MPDVSVIIVNYNTRDVTLACIDSIAKKTSGVSYEIIVVDNASTDGSREALSTDGRILYIYNAYNSGFGTANNIGMRHARGKYLFLLNSDTLLVNNAIKEFFDYAEADGGRHVLGCYLQGRHGEYKTSFFYFPAFTFRDFFRRIFRLKKPLPADYRNKDVECITGADMFFSHEAVAKSGGFNENIFLYGEESELQWRMLKADFPCRIIATPKIIHLEGESSKDKCAPLRIHIDSHFITLRLHMHYSTYLCARTYYFLNFLFRSAISFRLWKDRHFLRSLLRPVCLDSAKNAPDVSCQLE